VKDDWYVDRFRDRRPQFYQRLMKEVKHKSVRCYILS
jgi:hypothetical protein